MNVLRTWGKILNEVSGSRLFLKDKSLSFPSTRDSLVKEFETVGIAKNRLTLEGSSSRYDYLRAYNQADIALSPFPYGGGTTSAEGLWMGVPFLTKKEVPSFQRLEKALRAILVCLTGCQILKKNMWRRQFNFHRI